MHLYLSVCINYFSTDLSGLMDQEEPDFDIKANWYASSCIQLAFSVKGFFLCFLFSLGSRNL